MRAQSTTTVPAGDIHLRLLDALAERLYDGQFIKELTGQARVADDVDNAALDIASAPGEAARGSAVTILPQWPYVPLADAESALGLSAVALRRLRKRLGIRTHRIERDRRAFLARQDFNTMRALRIDGLLPDLP